MATKPTARQQARQAIKDEVDKQLLVAKQNLRSNRSEFQKLHDKQEVLKRKVAEIAVLIKTLENV